jgi:hypothetical protein
MAKIKSSPLDKLKQDLYDEHVSEQDQLLLNCIFIEEPTQELLDHAMQVCDIEVLGGHKSLLLSYLMQANPELKLPDYSGPRIEGVFRYFRFANMKVLAHFSKIGRALNKASIPLLLFKGGAMKVLRPELSRRMSDIDIVVPREHFDQAVQICESLGYLRTELEARHSVDFHTETENAVDMHHSLFGASKYVALFEKKLFKRAAKSRAYSVDFLLPCHEDLFFFVLTNFTKNLHHKTSLKGLYFALCDSNFLQSDKFNFDWSIVRENAKLCTKEHEVRFAIEFMNMIVPGIVPDIDKTFPSPRGMNTFCNRIEFERKHYLELQKVCQQIRVVQLKNHPKIHGKRILKYLFMQQLRHVPAFVAWYLNSQKSQGDKLAIRESN